MGVLPVRTSAGTYRSFSCLRNTPARHASTTGALASLTDIESDRVGDNWMITFKPQSILQLTITGFLAVSATLVVALVLTAKKLDGLSVTSQSIVSTTTEAMAYSRILIEQASAMERNTLQF